MVDRRYLRLSKNEKKEKSKKKGKPLLNRISTNIGRRVKEEKDNVDKRVRRQLLPKELYLFFITPPFSLRTMLLRFEFFFNPLFYFKTHIFRIAEKSSFFSFCKNFYLITYLFQEYQCNHKKYTCLINVQNQNL